VYGKKAGVLNGAPNLLLRARKVSCLAPPLDTLLLVGINNDDTFYQDKARDKRRRASVCTSFFHTQQIAAATMQDEEEDPANPRPRQRRRLALEDDDDDDDASRDGPATADNRAARLARRAAIQRASRVGRIRLLGDDDDEDAAAPHPVPDDDDDDDEVDQDYDALGLANEEEEEDGEDLMEHADRDYQRIDALDTYGTEGIDDRDFDGMDLEERQKAEAEMRRRDRGRNQGFYGLLDAVETEEDDEARQARRAMFGRRGPEEEEEDEVEEEEEEDLDGEDPINLEAFDVPLREWIAQDRTRREIQRKFRAFLKHFRPEVADTRRRRGNGLYEQKIRNLCAANRSSLTVSYLHLMNAEPVLAYWLADAPKDMFLVLNEGATRHTLSLFPSYSAIQSEIHVRISEVPILDSLRDLRRSHLDCLVKVNGVVTRRSTVYPQLQMAYYLCQGCKNVQGPFRVEGVGRDAKAAEPDLCPNCDMPNFKLHPNLCVYRNVQRVNLQETPGSVPPGRVPRTKEVLLSDDLIDAGKPGEEVEVTGVFEHAFDASLTIKSGFPVFSTFIHANHVAKREDASSALNLSEADIQQILELARDPKIGDRLVQSIAPSIFGHDFCKMALAMSLFGGVAKNVNDKHRIRGRWSGRTLFACSDCVTNDSILTPYALSQVTLTSSFWVILVRPRVRCSSMRKTRLHVPSTARVKVPVPLV
jgi:DNA replication licensing factor MCM2